MVRPEVLDINEVLQRMGTMIEAAGRREPRAGAVAVTTSLGKVKVDVGSLEQVIMNLVFNARDAVGRVGAHHAGDAETRCSTTTTAARTPTHSPASTVVP